MIGKAKAKLKARLSALNITRKQANEIALLLYEAENEAFEDEWAKDDHPHA